MGANCCIAARRNSISDRQADSVHLACSPSCSLHDNEAHRNDTCDNPSLHGNLDGSALEVTDYIHTHDDNHPEGGNSSCSSQSPNWNTCTSEEVDGNISTRKEDGGTGIDMPITENNPESSEAAASESTSDSKQLVPLHSSPSSSRKPFSPSITFPSGSQSSRKARQPFGYKIYKQISESQLIRSFREHGPSERRKSLMHSSRNDGSGSAGGSHGGLADRWSLLLFSELGSQQGQLTLDDEKAGDGQLSPANDHKCGLCLKALNGRSRRSSQTLGRIFEVPVVAALCCGHVYHAECLEKHTLEVDKYDPPCPVCTSASKQGASSSKKARNKQHSRSAVGDFDLDASTDFEQQKSTEHDEKISKRNFGLKSSLTKRFWRSQI